MIHSVTIGGIDKASLLSALQGAGVQLNQAAQELFADGRFTTASTRRTLEVVELAVAELTDGDEATFDQVLEHAARRGLAPCPFELAPHFRLQYLDQPEGSLGHPLSQHRAPPGSITLASLPLAHDNETPKGFYLRRIDGVNWLRGYRSWPGHLWSPEDVFAFARSQR
jgi:hypothetical protein